MAHLSKSSRLTPEVEATVEASEKLLKFTGTKELEMDQPSIRLLFFVFGCLFLFFFFHEGKIEFLIKNEAHEAEL